MHRKIIVTASAIALAACMATKPAWAASPAEPAATGSTAVWPIGTWLMSPGFSNGNAIALLFGTAYFTPVLLPADSRLTKLGIAQDTGADNTGQMIRICLYRSDSNGMPSTLIVDGGEAPMTTYAQGDSDVVTLASITTTMVYTG
jgi:hypothetical protein